jgi:tRNA threonylcarbamoyladenosine modification (KEOPS) complex Cgi121 subunit
MIIIKSNGFEYYIGIYAIKLKLNNKSLEDILGSAHKIQMNFPGSVIQFFNDEFVLNQKHLINACYYSIKSFSSNRNIASSINIELLLYLACNRQIKFSLKFFGLSEEILEKEVLHYCVIDKLDKISEINTKLIAELDSIPQKPKILEQSLEKFNKVKKFFNFTDKKLEVIFRSYNIKPEHTELNLENLDIFYECLNDLISEKMTLLSLEKA